MQKSAQVWHLYILLCADQTYYTGITTDLTRRVAQHNLGKGAKYTRGRSPLKLVFTESFGDKGSALMREAEIKMLPKISKRELVTNYICAAQQ